MHGVNNIRRTCVRACQESWSRCVSLEAENVLSENLFKKIKPGSLSNKPNL
jgi:hypothetical protein